MTKLKAQQSITELEKRQKAFEHIHDQFSSAPDQTDASSHYTYDIATDRSTIYHQKPKPDFESRSATMEPEQTNLVAVESETSTTSSEKTEVVSQYQASITTMDVQNKIESDEIDQERAGHMLIKAEMDKLKYEDPMITKLKNTNVSRDLHHFNEYFLKLNLFNSRMYKHFMD